jgi:hypothetical protein
MLMRRSIRRPASLKVSSNFVENSCRVNPARRNDSAGAAHGQRSARSIAAVDARMAVRYLPSIFDFD